MVIGVEAGWERIWAEISLENAKHNIESIRKHIRKDCKIMAVIKADAYGHGAVRLARLYEEMGVQYLAVATLGEALALRRGGIGLPILILGITPPESAGKLIENRITQTVFDLDYARRLSNHAQRGNGKLKVHIKVDTGMSRLGFLCTDKQEKAIREIAEVCGMDGLEAEGIFTHLANADTGDDEYTQLQFSRFSDLLDSLGQSGMQFSLRHCANSAGVINYSYTHMDMVRPGLILYGVYPDESMRERIDLRPVLSLKCRVAQVKDLQEDVPVSYGGIYHTPKPARIGVITAGYADGLMRRLSGNAEFIIRGVRAEQVGRICMDMCMADVTHIPDARSGDAAVIIGSEGSESITAEQVARKAGTIPYEVTCSISKRVPRIYL